MEAVTGTEGEVAGAPAQAEEDASPARLAAAAAVAVGCPSSPDSTASSAASTHTHQRDHTVAIHAAKELLQSAAGTDDTQPGAPPGGTGTGTGADPEPPATTAAGQQDALKASARIRSRAEADAEGGGPSSKRPRSEAVTAAASESPPPPARSDSDAARSRLEQANAAASAAASAASAAANLAAATVASLRAPLVRPAESPSRSASNGFSSNGASGPTNGQNAARPRSERMAALAAKLGASDKNDGEVLRLALQRLTALEAAAAGAAAGSVPAPDTTSQTCPTLVHGFPALSTCPLLDSIPAALLTLDGRFADANQPFASLFALPLLPTPQTPITAGSYPARTLNGSHAAALQLDLPALRRHTLSSMCNNPTDAARLSRMVSSLLSGVSTCQEALLSFINPEGDPVDCVQCVVSALRQREGSVLRLMLVLILPTGAGQPPLPSNAATTPMGNGVSSHGFSPHFGWSMPTEAQHSSPYPLQMQLQPPINQQQQLLEQQQQLQQQQHHMQQQRQQHEQHQFAVSTAAAAANGCMVLPLGSNISQPQQQSMAQPYFVAAGPYAPTAIPQPSSLPSYSAFHSPAGYAMQPQPHFMSMHPYMTMQPHLQPQMPPQPQQPQASASLFVAPHSLHLLQQQQQQQAMQLQRSYEIPQLMMHSSGTASCVIPAQAQTHFGAAPAQTAAGTAATAAATAKFETAPLTSATNLYATS